MTFRWISQTPRWCVLQSGSEYARCSRLIGALSRYTVSLESADFRFYRELEESGESSNMQAQPRCDLLGRCEPDEGAQARAAFLS